MAAASFAASTACGQDRPVTPNLIYFHQADRSGHFAAWEEPDLFATEIRAAFISLR
jgi:pimeloyl-ACP methyl ester carboxylesterase